MSRRALGSLKHKLVLLVVAAAVALLGAELAVRLFDIGPEIAAVWSGNHRLSANPALRYELLPGSPDGESSINSHGMRDREYSVSKVPGVFRIACIGDSIVYGYGVTQDESYCARLEQMLDGVGGAGGVTFEVLNFGVTGYSFTQIMENLRTRVLPFDPDLIHYAYCLNDPQEYSLEMAGLLAELTHAERDHFQRALHSGHSWASRSRLYLLSRYLLAARTDEGKQTGRPTRPWEDDRQLVAIRSGRYAEYYTQLHTTPADWQPVERGLLELQRRSEDSGVPVQIAIFPILTDLGDYPLRDLHRMLGQRFAQHGFRTLDLLEYYRSYERATGSRLGATFHPSAEGHALTAIAVLRDLLDAGLLPALDRREVERRLAAAHPRARTLR